MAARLFREGLLDSPRVCRLTLEARWLFVTICLVADDVGLFDAEPYALVRRADLQSDLGDTLLAMLVDADLIRLYSVPERPGKRFGFIPRFGQRLQIKRARFPMPPPSLAQDDPDALNKIKHLTSIPPHSTVAHGVPPSEPEPEPEPEETRPSISKDRASPSPDKPAKAKARRKPPTVEEWPIPRELREWAREGCPLVDIVTETATFRDHEFASARSDWPATWRNWMRKEQKRLAELARRETRAAGKSFRKQDGDQIASSLSKLTGGRLGRRPSPQGEVLDMETHRDRLDSD